MVSRMFVGIFLICLSALLAFGGGQQEKQQTETGEKVVLTVWADSFFTPKWQGRQGPVLDAIWRDFEAKENVKLELQLVPYPDFQAKLLTALSAGNPPDVAIADQYWLASMVNTGGVEDIGAAWPQRDREDFFNWSVEGVMVEGKVYGIWYSTDARVLYFKKDILAEKGFMEPPKTWQELYGAAQKLNSTDQYGLGMVLSGEGGMCTLLIDYWSLDGGLVDSKGKPAFNSGANKEALTKIFEFDKMLYDEKLIPSDSVTYMSENDMNPRIFAGGYAMFFGGGWQIGNIQDNMNPQAAAQWDIHLRPQPAGGKPSSLAGGFDLNVFVSDPVKKDKAVKFIRHLSDPVNGAKFAAASRGLPVRKSVYQTDSFFSTDPYMIKYGQILPYAKTRPNSVIYPIISDSVMKAMGEYISGEKSIEQALSDAEKRVLTQQ
jgi:multiple sugar transport system substrate-binding protein